MTRNRRSIRLKGFDYSRNGAYFVTICTHNRTCLFGDCMNGEFSPNGAGRMVEACWNELPERFPNVWLDEFIVMPNHIHGVIMIQSHDHGGDYQDLGDHKDSGDNLGDHKDRPYITTNNRRGESCIRPEPCIHPELPRHHDCKPGDHEDQPQQTTNNRRGESRIRPESCIRPEPCIYPELPGNHGFKSDHPDNLGHHQDLGDHEDRPYQMVNDHRGESYILSELPGNHHFKYGHDKDRPHGTLPGSLGRMIQAFKSLTTLSYIDGVKRGVWPVIPGRLWQRNYFEHIVRDEDELNLIREYISNNPFQWEMDQENPVAYPATMEKDIP